MGTLRYAGLVTKLKKNGTFKATFAPYGYRLDPKKG
jgi:hypothetical protein